MSDLIAIAYPDLDTAKKVAANVASLQKSHDIELDDLVVAERKDDGKVKLHQPSLAGVGAASGALWGGLIGLLFLAPLLGMAVGAAAGAAGGALSDYGVDDNFMKDLASELEPGSAAVIALVRKMPAERFLERIEHEGRVIRTSLDDDREQQLSDALAAAGAR